MGGELMNHKSSLVPPTSDYRCTMNFLLRLSWVKSQPVDIQEWGGRADHSIAQECPAYLESDIDSEGDVEKPDKRHG
jgi:hypothetical protein